MLTDKNNEFISFNQFKESYDIETNFLQFYGMCSWKEHIKNREKKLNITCDKF